MNEPIEKTVTFVCVGRSFHITEKVLRHGYVYDGRLDPQLPRANALWFAKPLGAGKRGSDVVGGLYEGKISIDGNGHTSAHGRWTFKGVISDKDLRVQLKALDDGQEGDYRAHRDMKRAKSDDPVYEALEPIREAYKQANTAGRRAIIAKVLQRIGAS
jgi:hypothetical protein